MQACQYEWGRYEELRPDELSAIVQASPIAFWPLGLLEHHGWHLPVGLDGLKAERICVQIAQRTGGVVLPTMWWGGRGGHGSFMWTLYQAEDAAKSIVEGSVRRLIAFGFRAIVLLAGHYPWREILNDGLRALQEQHPEVLLVWGTEADIGGTVRLPGDHAAREETSYGLALFPELVDMDALRPGRDSSAWPQGQAPAAQERHPRVRYDPEDPLYAQMGEDARTGSAERGEKAIRRLLDYMANTINQYLGRKPAAGE